MTDCKGPSPQSKIFDSLDLQQRMLATCAMMAPCMARALCRSAGGYFTFTFSYSPTWPSTYRPASGRNIPTCNITSELIATTKMPSRALGFLKKKKKQKAKGGAESPIAKAAAAGGASAAVAVAAETEQQEEESPFPVKIDEPTKDNEGTTEAKVEVQVETDVPSPPSPRRGYGPVDVDEMGDSDLEDNDVDDAGTTLSESQKKLAGTEDDDAGTTWSEFQKKLVGNADKKSEEGKTTDADEKGMLEKILDASTSCCT